jgi:2-polyprenyl-3-methyl-5-hydroxy-6-metoxy-1,4-benzoquinol methylase
MSFYDIFHRDIRVQKKIISDDNFTYRHIINIKVLKPLILKQNLTILDYGCGVGTVDFYLASKGSRIMGIDISRDAIKVCRESAKKIGVSDRTKFEDINFKSLSTYDLIICSEIIEHVPDDLILLRKLTKHLKIKGYLYVSTPSIKAPLYRLGIANDFDKMVGHLRRYELSTLIEKIETIGYKIVFVKKTEGILRNSFFVFPLLNWFVRFIKGPISDLVTLLDDILVKIFGESNIIILAQKV